MSGLFLHLVECFFTMQAHEPCCPTVDCGGRVFCCVILIWLRGAIFEYASKVYAYAQSCLSWFSVGSVFDVQLCAVEGAYALHDG